MRGTRQSWNLVWQVHYVNHMPPGETRTPMGFGIDPEVGAAATRVQAAFRGLQS